jgi:hypothetical protein
MVIILNGCARLGRGARAASDSTQPPVTNKLAFPAPIPLSPPQSAPPVQGAAKSRLAEIAGQDFPILATLVHRDGLRFARSSYLSTTTEDSSGHPIELSCMDWRSQRLVFLPDQGANGLAGIMQDEWGP